MSSGKTLQNASHPNQQPPTPSLAKRKKIKEKTDIRSPTDSLMSPCTRRLMRKAAKDMQLLLQIPTYSTEDKENAPS
ncbi:hypothetical protein MATL_G00248400 [Megalops atlanticus]|uniref:Uncharacterized protein n=1 Tax=Megalops atlanticus TaxID=7932 RepID=A0A9D3PB12_MEGAT|nr:hypothetical protein MATL_G00248400 [Megalops atlanticus]